MRLPAVLVALLLSALCSLAGTVEDYAQKVAPLIDPAKIATLGKRGANPRVQKCAYWLAMAKADKVQPGRVVSAALRIVGMTNQQVAELTQAALSRSL